jgi:hypothetical protein
MTQSSCSSTPIAEMTRPPQKQQAAANMARRGPPSSTQRPSTAAERPKNTMAIEKIQPSSVSFQSLGAESVMPMTRLRGMLNGLKA